MGGSYAKKLKGDKLNKDLNLSKNTNERKDVKILENFD